jgi:hypothetical protein
VVRKRSGYVTVLYVVLGLVGFFVITTFIGVWMFVHSETGQKIVSTVGKSFTLMQQASQAPGTAELRARGCTTAMVIPFNQVMQVFREIAPDADREIDRGTLPGEGTMVFCQPTTDETSAPACADVARTYANAVPQAPERFGVTVQTRSGKVCDGTYGRDGTLIAPFNTNRRRSRPDAPVEQGNTPSRP